MSSEFEHCQDNSQTIANSFEVARLRELASQHDTRFERLNDRLISVERFQWMIIGGLVVGNFLQIALKFIK